MTGERESDETIEYRGINHVALVCRDMAETVAFYDGVLGMKLVKTLDLPNGRGQHFFFDCGNGDTIAFFWFPNAPKAAPEIASMHPDYQTRGTQTAHASMNHLAVSIPLEKFDEYAERLRQRGVALRVLNHDDGPQHASRSLRKIPGSARCISRIQMAFTWNLRRSRGHIVPAMCAMHQ